LPPIGAIVRAVMIDLIYIAVVIAFFVICALYARFCEKL
jgi:hypothetical protein